MAGIAVTRRPDQRLVRVGEAPAAKVRYRVSLAPDDVVENPVAQVLEDGAHPEDVVVAADHPQRPVRLQQSARSSEPGPGEAVVGFEIVESVPGVLDAIDPAVIRTAQLAL